MSNTPTTPPNLPTPEQLEAAARHFCTLKGIDPDEQIKIQPVPGPNGPVDQIARWQTVVRAVLDQWCLNEAIARKIPPHISLV